VLLSKFLDSGGLFAWEGFTFFDTDQIFTSLKGYEKPKNGDSVKNKQPASSGKRLGGDKRGISDLHVIVLQV
jgi:hypothetical protein